MSHTDYGTLYFSTNRVDASKSKAAKKFCYSCHNIDSMLDSFGNQTLVSLRLSSPKTYSISY